MKNLKIDWLLKSSTALLFLFLLNGPLLAQKGNSHIAIGLEAGPSLGFGSEDFPYQLGIPVKAYLGTGQHGQWMFRTGGHLFPVSSQNLHESIRRAYRYIVPIALGYRYNLENWYAEGSLGVGLNTFVQVPTDAQFQRQSWINRELNYGLELGCQMERFDLGVSLNNNGPIPHNTMFLGLKAMYKIGL
ncbi:hypothetical protein KIH41_11270 [Litoribacter ruber]|uniref:hypothetical protein n=1 Tax=Litoribacter ruber TaxID=702568 RepID=UPI001BD9E26B|nr:hypothetical protein [Litoribacter ruber]MBT0811857.1 hypothetical protein [Litoribacter ruber]